MTEPKYWHGQAAISRESIERSKDMVLVKTEQKLLVELYMEADMPRDFRIQFRYDPLDQQNAILCVARLTVIDPTNPRLEDDKDWFKWVKHAPVHEDVTYTRGDRVVSRALNEIYEPVIKKQLEEAAKFAGRDLATFDALSGLGAVKAKVEHEMNRQYIGIETGFDADSNSDWYARKLREDPYAQRLREPLPPVPAPPMPVPVQPAQFRPTMPTTAPAPAPGGCPQCGSVDYGSPLKCRDRMSHNARVRLRPFYPEQHPRSAGSEHGRRHSVRAGAHRWVRIPVR